MYSIFEYCLGGIVLDSSQFAKPSNMRYVDLCIYIDKTFYTPERDDSKCFEYMCILAYMLANKANYFTSTDDYTAYACFLAQSTYQRMANPNKVKIKSVLNYMRSIMYFRKVSYLRDSFSEVIDPEYNKEWNSDLYIEKETKRLESKNHYLLQELIFDILQSIPQVIKDNIPEVYKRNKLTFRRLYLSCLISFLSQITLNKDREDYYEAKQETVTTFNDSEYLNKHRGDNLRYWRISSDLEPVVKIVLNKTKHSLIQDIYETMDEFKIDQDELEDLNFNLIQGEQDD